MKSTNPMKQLDDMVESDKCLECNGFGFKEIDGGIVQELCVKCGGTGIKDYMTQDEAVAVTLEDALTAKMPHLADIPVPEAERLEGESEVKGLIIPEPIEGKTIEETVDIARKLVEASKEDESSNSGTEPDNQPDGSGDTSKPEQPSKPKAKKKARKKPG